MRLLKIYLLTCLMWAVSIVPTRGQIPFACPANVGFELGNLSTWLFYTCNDWNTPTFTQTAPVNNRHTLTNGTAVDPYGGFPIVCPGSGAYSLKLGNNSTGSQAEAAQFYVSIPAGVSNYSLIYRYAVVFENPNHTPSQQPKFEVKAFDSATGAAYPCAQFTYISSSSLPGFQLSSVGTQVYYKAWTTVALDLSGLSGQTVGVRFTSYDCLLGAHFGYGYVDMSCGLFQISTINCPGATTTTLTAPPGFQSYTWMDSTFTNTIATGQTVTIPVPPQSTLYYVVLNPYPGYGCPDTLSTRVYVSDINANANNDTLICNGSSVQLHSGGSGSITPLTYSWTPSSTLSCNNCSNPTATPTAASTTYHVTVTDANGCSKHDSVIVTIGPFLNKTSTNVSCFGGNNGSATAIATGGLLPYSYSWNTTPPQTSATASNLTAGTYNVTVTDSKNCSQNTSVTITQPATAVASNIPAHTNINCNGGTNGSATVTASGGVGPYTYSWNTTPVQTTTTATNLPAGNYTATATDSHGCTSTSNVTITQPAVLSATIAKNDVNCFNGTTGNAIASVTGGTTPYTYSWNTSPVQTSATANNLAAGNYTVTVTDNKGCSTTSSITITQPTTLSAAITKTDVSCNGGNNGTAAVTATGGTTPYAYSWNTTPVQTASSINNLAAGNYTITVTDNKGCTVSSTATIAQPTVLSTTVSKTNVSCNGGNNGTATVTTTGGTIPYAYSWNTLPAQSTMTANNLSAGNYTITVTDNKGCIATNNITITQPPILTTTISKTDVNCNGGTTGNAAVAVSGGTTPYTYSWNTTPVQTTATANNLPAGTYAITVTDNKGCTATNTATITQPSLLTTSLTHTDVNCNGGNNASATVTTSGGTTPYTYSWNTTPAQTTATANNLTVGTYTITVTDNKQCIATNSVTITQPAALNISMAHTNVFCNGGNNGTATATVTGGTIPYAYSWNTTPVQTTNTANNLSAGNYTITVTDNKGCTLNNSVTISEPTPLNASITKTDVSCNTGNNGSATVAATGGTTPYTYSWNTSPVQTTAIANNLVAGNYTVIITDNKGCTKNQNITITQPAVLATTMTHTDVSCGGGNTGTATVSVTGGTTPYAYSWNTTPAQTSDHAVNLGAGNYTVTVTDNKGCLTTNNVTIAQPSTLGASVVTTNVSCNGGNNGTAVVTATGGTTPYIYSWNTTPVQTAASVNGLTAGSYTVTTTDNKGCSVSNNLSITQPPALAVSVSKTDVNCYGGATGTATANVTGGTLPYTYSWNTTPVQTSVTANNLQAATYTIQVTDSKGCIVNNSATIAQPPALNVSLAQTDVNCFGGSNGTATVTATGGTPAYTYSWNTIPVQTSAIANNLSAGNYIVTVTDNKGCTQSPSVAITQPTSILAASISNSTNVNCYGANTGGATVIASGGTSPYTYSWNTAPVQTTATASNLSAGTYTITVTDSKGCNASTNTSIIQPTAIVATATQTNVNCFGGSTGTASVVVSGGTPAYTYSWNTTPVQTTANINTLAAGNYTVTILDNNGCTHNESVNITQPTSALSVTTSNISNVKCFGDTTGSIVGVASGGTTPYTYLWNTGPAQTAATAHSLSAGSYILTVTDAKGCIANLTAQVNQPPQLSIAAQSTSKTCPGAATGTASSIATGGVSPYYYLWNTTPPQTNASAEHLGAGTYSVQVTDSNGCLSSANILVESYPAPIINADTDRILCSGTNTILQASGAQTYLWSPASGLSCSTCQITMATPTTTTTYTVIGTDANQCQDSDKVVVTVIPKLVVDAGPEKDICIDEKVQLHASGGISYFWSPSADMDNNLIADPVVQPKTDTKYSVIITENECFKDTLYQNVKVFQRPTVDLGPDFKGIPGSIVQLNAVTTNANKITWQPATGLSCDDCYTPLATLLKDITYIATVSNNGKCTATDTLNIFVACDGSAFFMANTFTPNGDGRNDRFYPQGKGINTVHRFMIYDRWGEIVYQANDFEANNEQRGWDGTFRGNPVKPDVFVYVVEAVCLNGSTVVVKGDISLVR